jgi:uncharacterized protein (TIGR01777 family)
MNIVIAGGSGMIGKSLAIKLIEAGHKVTVLSRSPQKAISQLPTSCKVELWDPPSEQSMPMLEGVDGIVNLAGESIGNGYWTKAKKERIISSRVNAGNTLSRAIKQMDKKLSMFIQASAVGFYGTRVDEILEESAIPGKGFLTETCLAWEQSTAEVENMDFRRVTIRTGFVMDKSEGALRMLALPFQLFFGGRVGAGMQWLPWIHLEDEVRAIQFLLENPKCAGVYNLSAPNPARNQDFGRVLASVMKRPFWFPLPEFLLKLVLGDMATLLLDSQRMIPSRLTQDGFQFSYPDVRSALMAIYGPKKVGS